MMKSSFVSLAIVLGVLASSSAYCDYQLSDIKCSAQRFENREKYMRGWGAEVAAGCEKFWCVDRNKGKDEMLECVKRACGKIVDQTCGFRQSGVGAFLDGPPAHATKAACEEASNSKKFTDSFSKCANKGANLDGIGRNIRRNRTEGTPLIGGSGSADQ